MSICTYTRFTPLIQFPVNEDILGLIMGGQMALLPDPDSISKMLTLLHHNFYCPLNERRPFYKVRRLSPGVLNL